jgi:hypothetical protein
LVNELTEAVSQIHDCGEIAFWFRWHCLISITIA